VSLKPPSGLQTGLGKVITFKMQHLYSWQDNNTPHLMPMGSFAAQLVVI